MSAGRDEVVQRVRVSGELALFTRPEFKVERVSYPVITPSAARGVLEAILWKPAIRWRVRRIKVLAPIKFLGLKRNELAGKISGPTAAVVEGGGPMSTPTIEDKRQQRNSVLLRDVDYVIEARFEMTKRAGQGDNPGKFADMFRRRVEKGQHFHQPYLGCREFVAKIQPATGDETPIDETRDLGLMVYDTEFVPVTGKQKHSVTWRDGDQIVRGHAHQELFAAKLVNGVMEIPDDPAASIAEAHGLDSHGLGGAS